MFKITPINDVEFQKKCAEVCGAEYRPGYFAYVMQDNDSLEIMGMSQFEILEKGGFIADLRPRIGLDDPEAMFILGRATMNFIDMCQSHVCYISETAGDQRLIRLIGFKENENGELMCDMTDMFSGHCSGETAKI